MAHGCHKVYLSWWVCLAPVLDGSTSFVDCAKTIKSTENRGYSFKSLDNYLSNKHCLLPICLKLLMQIGFE